MTSEDLATFIERRRRFVEAIGEGLAIIPAAQETARNSDVSHVFRQNSDFFFLTGFDEPDAVALFNPAHAKERFVLFVRPRDREMEIWNGHRAGVEGAVAHVRRRRRVSRGPARRQAARVRDRADDGLLPARHPRRSTPG